MFHLEQGNVLPSMVSPSITTDYIGTCHEKEEKKFTGSHEDGSI